MNTEITGTEAIRLRVWSRWKRANLSRTATDLSILLASLEAFAKGAGQLSELHLHALTKEFFPYNVRFDPVVDKLIDTTPKPPPAGVIPEPCVPGSWLFTVAHDPDRSLRQRDVTPSKFKPQSPQRSFKRPGFA